MSEPLMRFLKQVRVTHGMSQAALERCMDLPHGTYRHVEKGRRPMPVLENRLAEWVHTFEDCVGATTEERMTIANMLSRSILDQLAVLLQDIEQRKRRE